MSDGNAAALDKLREVREALVRPGTLALVKLRDYLSPRSPAWKAFVAVRPVPGYKVRRATLTGWIDEVIANLERAGLQEAPPAAETTPPSRRDRLRAEPRTSPMEGAVFSVETDQIARELRDRAAEDGDMDAAPAGVRRFGESLGNGLDDWYYGPEEGDAARAERLNLSRAQRAERERSQEEQRARKASASPPVEVSHQPSEAPPPRPLPPSRGTPLRRLTSAGIEKAREFLAELREHPEAGRTPPHELLYGKRYSQPFDPDESASIKVEPRVFRTRRDAGEYLAPLLAPVRHLVTDNAGVWSWLGMYYFADMSAPLAGRKRDTASEAFVFSDDESTTEARRSYQRRYRHWLRSSWRLQEQHGQDAAFLLDEDITSFTDLADRTFSDFRVFNSSGVVPLLIRLYTDGERLKSGYPRSPGGLRHLLRALPQLELTYDMYGMTPDALLRVLPEPFREWDARTA